MQTIHPFLWFNDDLEDVIAYYLSIFKDGEVLEKREHYDGPLKGRLFQVTFRLNNLVFMAINGGPYVKFSGAVSFLISCDSQKELDYYYDTLGNDGKIENCGWLVDKFGVTWQVVPKQLLEIYGSSDLEKIGRVTRASLHMERLNIEQLLKVE